MKKEIVLHAIRNPSGSTDGESKLGDLGESMVGLIDGYRPWGQVGFRVLNTTNGDTLVITDTYLPPVQREEGTRIPIEKIPGGEDTFVVADPNALTPGNIIFTGYGFPVSDNRYQGYELQALRADWLSRLGIDEAKNIGRASIRMGNIHWIFGDIPHREGFFHRTGSSGENKQMAEIGYAVALLHHHMDFLGVMKDCEHIYGQIKTGGRLRHLIRITKDRGGYFINRRPGNLIATLAKDLGVEIDDISEVERQISDWSVEDLLDHLSRKANLAVDELLDRVTTAIIEIPDDRNSIAEPRKQNRFEVQGGKIRYVDILDGREIKRRSADSIGIYRLLQAAINAELRIADVGLMLTRNPDQEPLWEKLGLNPESPDDVQTLEVLREVGWLTNPIGQLDWTADRQAVAEELQRIEATMFEN